jgi:hypothetical protein
MLLVDGLTDTAIVGPGIVDWLAARPINNENADNNNTTIPIISLAPLLHLLYPVKFVKIISLFFTLTHDEERMHRFKN